MSNKAMEVLTDGSVGEDFWRDAFYDELCEEVAEELTESTGVNFEMDDDGETLVIDGAAVRFVDNFGGEGQGSDFWVVLSVEKDGVVRYVKNNGWDTSYEGGSFDSAEGVEVFPYKETSTKWTTDENEKNTVVDRSII